MCLAGDIWPFLLHSFSFWWLISRVFPFTLKSSTLEQIELGFVCFDLTFSFLFSQWNVNLGVLWPSLIRKHNKDCSTTHVKGVSSYSRTHDEWEIKWGSLRSARELLLSPGHSISTLTKSECVPSYLSAVVFVYSRPPFLPSHISLSFSTYSPVAFLSICNCIGHSICTLTETVCSGVHIFRSLFALLSYPVTWASRSQSILSSVSHIVCIFSSLLLLIISTKR